MGVNSEKKKISIAMQGGGIQSAYAWGVIDMFLQDERIEITGLSSTGLSGISCAAVIQGLVLGGNSEASSILRKYWIGINEVSKKMEPLISNPLEKIINYYNFITNHNESDHFMKHGVSPYEMNPMNINPVLEFIESFFNFSIINDSDEKKLFIGTTNVESGKMRIFSNKEITPKVLMASFCLPYVFHAVEIDGEHYWDGGMIANPAINPLINGVDSKDIVIIQFSRSRCNEPPVSYYDIERRIREINNNAHLVREMRAIYFITNLIDSGAVVQGKLKRINMHVIRNEKTDIDVKNSFSSNWESIMMLYSAGYSDAKKWIASNFDKIGVSHSAISDEVFDKYV